MSVFKYGVPKPVTGSQPDVAFQLAYGTKNAWPPTSEDPVQPVDPPSTMSVKPVWLSEYSHGFKKPILAWDFSKRAAFSRDMMAAKTGAEALGI